MPPRAGTHPVSSMIQPSHESGQRQSPGGRGDRLGVPAVLPPAWWHHGVPALSPSRPCGVAGTCGRPVLVPHHAHVLPQSLRQRHRHGRHVAVLRRRDGGVTAGNPPHPQRALMWGGSRRTHLVDAPGAGGRTDAPHEGGATAAALKRPTPARKRTVGTGDGGSRPRGGDAAALLTRRGGRCRCAPPAPRAGTSQTHSGSPGSLPPSGSGPPRPTSPWPPARCGC